MANEIAYKMIWTETGLDQTLGKSLTGCEKLSTATSGLISRLEKKATVADMGADAFALAQAKASGASAETLHYISGLQGVIQHIKEVKSETSEAAAETKRLTGARQQLLDGVKAKVIETKVQDPHDLEKLRLARQLKATGAKPEEIQGALHNLDFVRDQRLRQQQQQDDDGRRQKAIERHAAVPDNEDLRRQSEYDRTQREQAETRERQRMVEERRAAVPDNEVLRQQSEQVRIRDDKERERVNRRRRQEMADSYDNDIEEARLGDPHEVAKHRVRKRLKEYNAPAPEVEQIMGKMDDVRDADGQRQYRREISSRRAAAPQDNEQLRQASEAARLAAGERALAEVNEQLRKSTRALREEEIAAIRTKMDLAGATSAQKDAASKAIDTHQNDARAMRTFRSMTEQEGPVLKRLTVNPEKKAAASKNAGIGLELSRAVEDSIAGGAYGGVKGAIMGASNNISQMGAMMGPQAAIIASITSMVAVLGVTAWSAYAKWGEGVEKAKKANEDMKESMAAQREALQEQIALRKELSGLEDVKGKKEAEKTVKVKEDNIADLKAEQRLKQDQVKGMMYSVGFTDMHKLQDLEDARKNPDIQWNAPGENGFGRTLEIKHDRITPDFQNDAFKLQQEADLMSHKIANAEKVRDKAKEILKRETIAETGTQNEEGKASRKVTKEDDADARQERRVAAKRRQEQVQDLRLSMVTERDKDGRLVDDDGRRQRAAKAELERRERDVQIDKWKKEGIITGGDAEGLKKQSTETRDTEIRKINEKPVGNRAQALDIRSSEGMNQLLRALNVSKEDIAKQQLDVEKQILTAIQDGNQVKPQQLDVKEVRWN